MLEPELVIVSLNTDLYNMKCQLLLLALENKVLRERIKQITSVVNFTPPQMEEEKVKAKTVGS